MAENIPIGGWSFNGELLEWYVLWLLLRERSPGSINKRWSNCHEENGVLDLLPWKQMMISVSNVVTVRHGEGVSREYDQAWRNGTHNSESPSRLPFFFTPARRYMQRLAPTSWERVVMVAKSPLIKTFLVVKGQVKEINQNAPIALHWNSRLEREQMSGLWA